MNKIEHTDIRPLTDAEMGVVSGGITNAQTALGKAFISGFLAGGGTMGNPGTPWPPAGRGECNTNHNGVKY
jgi:hypothetical protein